MDKKLDKASMEYAIYWDGRVQGFDVKLEKDISEEEAQGIIERIMEIKGVESVHCFTGMIENDK